MKILFLIFCNFIGSNSLLFLRLSNKVKQINQKQSQALYPIFGLEDTCEYDIDCDLPQRCCHNFFGSFCCNTGGHGEKAKKPRLLPNVTIPGPSFPLPSLPPLPSPFPIPFPLPDPQPQPIPIPVPKFE